MAPKCGRIDVKYANCLYYTRIGLGKWTHDPTLDSTDLKLINKEQLGFCQVGCSDWRPPMAFCHAGGVPGKCHSGQLQERLGRIERI